MAVIAPLLLLLAVLGVVAALVSRATSRSPLGRALGAAIAMLLISVALYAVAMALAWNEPCDGPGGRGYELGGLDKPVSYWPPGARCPPFRAEKHQTVEEPIPWLKWSILCLAVGAPVVLLTGIAAEIRDRGSSSRSSGSKTPSR